MLHADLDEIEGLALKLLRRESPQAQDRLLREASNELLAWGIDAHMHLPRKGEKLHDTQAVRDLLNAPGLAQVANLQGVTLESVLGAEDFRDLLDRLIPANPDR